MHMENKCKILVLSDQPYSQLFKNTLIEILYVGKQQGIFVEIGILTVPPFGFERASQIKSLLSRREFSDFVQLAALTFCLDAYENGWVLKVVEILMRLDKPILTFPADPWRYSGKGANFLIQTGTAQAVTSIEEIFSNLTPMISSKSEISDSRVAHKG